MKEQRSRIQRKKPREKTSKKQYLWRRDRGSRLWSIDDKHAHPWGREFNIKLGSLFDNEDFFVEADPDIVAMIHELTI